MEQNKFKRTLVTAALPYANGGVHIGHLAGVYVPSDIYVRYLRLKKRDVLFVCGSDEHGVPITLRAKKEGCTPQDVCDRYHNIIKDSFKEFGISFDIYSRTTSETHQKVASDFFRTLYDKGAFIEKESEQYYDEEAKTFLADRYITGECPHCHYPKAYGDQCEHCGSTLSPQELINPQSAVSGSKPVLKKTKHWYLPLDKYQGWLEQWILQEHKEWRPNVYGQCKSWLDMGLQPRAVSRDLDWGIPVPVEGAEGKVLYVWFDAPIGYISNTKELLPDSWEKWWKDPSTRLIHFIGKDNIVFHCIVFPTMLKAEGSYILPDNVPANEFLNLEDDKISTSRNWAVWLDEYLKDFPGKQDVMRYVLTANAPETKDNNFTWKDFQARNNNELVAVYGNFINRALVLTWKYYDGKAPAQGELTDYDKETIAEFTTVKADVERLLENFRFRDAQKEAMNLARIGNKYLADSEPWKLQKTDPERVKTILNISLQLAANLAIAFEPFLPFSSKKLRGMLNMPDFRAYEHAFTMMSQVAGRAGRKGKRGLVVLQTKDVEQPVIRQVVENDWRAFYSQMMAERRLFHYPPFYKLIYVYLKHKDEGRVETAALEMGGRLRQWLGSRVLGPDKPSVSKVRTMFIRKIMLKLEAGIDMKRVRQCLFTAQRLMEQDKRYASLQIYYDVDPS